MEFNYYVHSITWIVVSLIHAYRRASGQKSEMLFFMLTRATLICFIYWIRWSLRCFAWSLNHLRKLELFSGRLESSWEFKQSQCLEQILRDCGLIGHDGAMPTIIFESSPRDYLQLGLRNPALRVYEYMMKLGLLLCPFTLIHMPNTHNHSVRKKLGSRLERNWLNISSHL